MSGLQGEIQDLLSGIGIHAERKQVQSPIAILVVDGSFDQKTDRVFVRFGTDIASTDPTTGELVPPEQVPTYGPYPLVMPIGEQFGPTGGERGWLIPVAGGGIVVLCNYDDAPGIEAGEWIRTHPARPQSSFYLKNDGSSVHSAETRAVVTAPRVCLGLDDSFGNDGVVRESDLQLLSDELTVKIQSAINSLAQRVQPGNGVPPPTVENTVAHASLTTFSA